MKMGIERTEEPFTTALAAALARAAGRVPVGRKTDQLRGS